MELTPNAFAEGPNLPSCHVYANNFLVSMSQLANALTRPFRQWRHILDRCAFTVYGLKLIVITGQFKSNVT
jgi:hypothetical protein